MRRRQAHSGSAVPIGEEGVNSAQVEARKIDPQSATISLEQELTSRRLESLQAPLKLEELDLTAALNREIRSSRTCAGCTPFTNYPLSFTFLQSVKTKLSSCTRAPLVSGRRLSMQQILQEAFCVSVLALLAVLAGSEEPGRSAPARPLPGAGLLATVTWSGVFRHGDN